MDKKFTRNFLKGTIATTIGTSSSMLFHFFSVIILIRQLSKDDFGIYILILVISNLFNILGSLGLDITLVKFISSDRESERKSILLPILTLKVGTLLGLCILFYLLSGFLLPLLDERIVDFTLYIPILFFFAGFRDLFYNLLQGLSLFRKYSTIQILVAALRLLLIFGLYIYKILTLEILLLLEVGVTVITIIFQMYSTPFKEIMAPNITKESYKKVLEFGFPLYINNIFTFIYDRVNLFIIGVILTPVSVALYDVAAKVPDALKKMFNSFIIVYFPNISKLFSQGKKDDAEILMNKSLLMFSFGITIIVLVSFLFKYEIVLLLFSEKYIDSAMAFFLLMLNFSFRALANILGYSIVSAGYSKVPMKVNLVSSIISVGGSLLMIPQFGFIGAVYALLIMNSIAQFAYLVYLIKVKISVDFIKYIMPIFYLAIMVGFYFLLGFDSLTLKITVIIIFILLNGITLKELRTSVISVIKYIPGFKTRL